LALSCRANADQEDAVRRWLFRIAVLTVCGWLASCASQPQPLVLTPKAGQFDRYRVTIDTFDESRVKGRYVVGFESHEIYEWDQKALPPINPQERRLQLVIRRLQTQTDLADAEPVRFDSDNRQEAIPPPFRPLLALVNRPLTLAMTPDGRVTKFEGFDAVEAALKTELSAEALPPEMLAAFRAHYGPGLWTDLIEFLYGSMPSDPRRKPIEWVRDRALHNPLFGRLPFKQTCRLRDSGKRSASIEIEGTIYPEDRAAAPPSLTGDAPLAFRQAKVTGSLTVDLARNRVSRGQREVTIWLGDMAKGEAKAESQPLRRITTKTFVEAR
jgi:hypothetical protein